jgi:hypothetical protein
METITKHKRGDVREDGMVFWALIRNQGYWVTKEKFAELKKRLNEWSIENRSKNLNLRREYEREWYSKNRIKKLEQKKVIRLNNIDFFREKDRLQWKKNPEKHRKNALEWNKNNPARAKQNLDKWKKENQDRYKLLSRKGSAKRRATQKNNTPDLTSDQNLIIETIYLQRIRLEKRFGLQFHVDHIIPISKGGLHIPSNLQVLPAKLNLQKNSRNSLRWEELQLI